jgi:hypothetical protein
MSSTAFFSGVGLAASWMLLLNFGVLLADLTVDFISHNFVKRVYVVLPSPKEFGPPPPFKPEQKLVKDTEPPNDTEDSEDRENPKL